MKEFTPTFRQGSPAKRSAIVRAALEVFLREGYARASVDAIAATAGVSKRTIYDYYGDKEQLFLSTLQEPRTRRRRLAGNFWTAPSVRSTTSRKP